MFSFVAYLPFANTKIFFLKFMIVSGSVRNIQEKESKTFFKNKSFSHLPKFNFEGWNIW